MRKNNSAAREQHSTEVQDIFIRYGAAYRMNHGKQLSVQQLKSMRSIELCRTAALGGHVEQCDSCGEVRISYNSCRNRQCPKCQFLKKEKWLEDRLKDFLPGIQYFHVVFTIPHSLNPLTLRNKAVVYNILFRSVSETLKELSLDKKHLGAQTGFICVLHTWGQNLLDHYHIHCIVTGGGLTDDNQRWISCRNKFLIHVYVLSELFRGKFLYYLRKSHKNGDLKFPGTISYLKEKKKFLLLLNELYKKEWVRLFETSFQES